MILDRFPEIQKLSPDEKLLVVTELWNDLEANPPKTPAAPEGLAELNRRMEHFHKHPEEFRMPDIAARLRESFGDEIYDSEDLARGIAESR